MSRIVRLLTLVVSFAALQLTLLGGGPGCPMPGAAATVSGRDGLVAPARAAMAGMTMAAPAATPDATPPHDHVPCDESAAPQACQTMAPCLFAVLAPLASTELPTSAPQSRLIAALVLTPPSETAAPELPPPRA